jgi:hypothetical protein
MPWMAVMLEGIGTPGLASQLRVSVGNPPPTRRTAAETKRSRRGSGPVVSVSKAQSRPRHRGVGWSPGLEARRTRAAGGKDVTAKEHLQEFEALWHEGPTLPGWDGEGRPSARRSQDGPRGSEAGLAGGLVVERSPPFPLVQRLVCASRASTRLASFGFRHDPWIGAGGCPPAEGSERPGAGCTLPGLSYRRREPEKSSASHTAAR